MENYVENFRKSSGLPCENTANPFAESEKKAAFHTTETIVITGMTMGGMPYAAAGYSIGKSGVKALMNPSSANSIQVTTDVGRTFIQNPPVTLMLGISDLTGTTTKVNNFVGKLWDNR